MTPIQITAAILGTDDDATVKLLDKITAAAAAGNTDTVLDLVNKIFTAGRDDATTDIVVDLKSENLDEAADFIKVNYL